MFSLMKGLAIAVHLTAYNGVDTWTQWSDLTVSNPRALTTISAPARMRGVPRERVDEVAAFRATQTGQATLSAAEQLCSANFGGHCDRGHRWSVTVRIT
jgi:hypothetical protein